jgi:hypothetical protein
MSTTPLRPAMVPITRQMRAYFAPVNRLKHQRFLIRE